MATKKKRGGQVAGKGRQALKTLSVQFASYVAQQAQQGQNAQKAVAAFTRHQAKIVSGILGGAGLAGGAWAAVSLWTGSLGLWSGLLYSAGLLTLPAWVPLVGGAAGLTAAGGAIYGVLNLTRRNQQQRRLQCIVGLSKSLMDEEELSAEDGRLLTSFLQAQNLGGDKVKALLGTPPREALRLALLHLSAEERLSVARYIFPLVYMRDGVIGDGDRRRFSRLCARLELDDDAARRISREYRQRLEEQWDYMDGLVDILGRFAERLCFDGREMELLREQLEQLAQFDPRRAAPARREKLLDRLGQPPAGSPQIELGDGTPAEAALMGAYALAHTAVPEEDRARLEEAFYALVETSATGEEYGKRLLASRRRIDRLYEATRQQILKAEQREEEGRK